MVKTGNLRIEANAEAVRQRLDEIESKLRGAMVSCEKAAAGAAARRVENERDWLRSLLRDVLTGPGDPGDCLADVREALERIGRVSEMVHGTRVNGESLAVTLRQAADTIEDATAELAGAACRVDAPIPGAAERVTERLRYDADNPLAVEDVPGLTGPELARYLDRLRFSLPLDGYLDRQADALLTEAAKRFAPPDPTEPEVSG